MTDGEYKAFLSALRAKAAVLSAASAGDLKESFLLDDVIVMEYELERQLERHPDYVRINIRIDEDLHLKYALEARRRGVATTELLAEAVIKMLEERKEPLDNAVLP